MSEFFIPVHVSHPRSGLTICFNDETVKQFRSWVGFDPRMEFVRFELKAGTAELHFRIAKSDGRGIHGNSQRSNFPFRVSFNPNPALDYFGQVAARLYPSRKDQEVMTATMTIDLANKRPPIFRQDQRRKESAAIAATKNPSAAIPATPTTLVLFSVGVHEFSFNVPIEEAMAKALDWTKRGLGV